MRLFTALFAAAIIASPALGQQAPAVSIDSGMTKAQVIERLGSPGIERSRGAYTYLFYVNGQEQRVGMNDLVVLHEDKVVDAIFRSPRRTYSGRSSSPRAIPPQEAARTNPSGVLRTGTSGQ